MGGRFSVESVADLHWNGWPIYRGICMPLKATVQRVCTDMYEGFNNAVREALPEAELDIDRFHVAKHYRDGVDAGAETDLI
jgi:hypothetical protein